MLIFLKTFLLSIDLIFDSIILFHNSIGSLLSKKLSGAEFLNFVLSGHDLNNWGSSHNNKAFAFSLLWRIYCCCINIK